MSDVSSSAITKENQLSSLRPDTGEMKNWSITRDIFALIAFLVTFFIYVLAAQATVSFWDCGEFISCSYLLAVPHPPGAPLYLLLGRLFSLIPLGVEVARKINWMSSLFNSLAIGVIFLILARVVAGWFGKIKNKMEAFIAIVGAATGAFFAGWGTTYWNNGLEAEVYGLAMLISAVLVYFAMLWSERHKNPIADRYIMLSAYLLYLGMFVHMTVLIMLPPLFLFYIIVDKAKRFNPVFWMTWFVFFLVATEFNIFVENFFTAFIIFALAALMTNNRSGKSFFLLLTGVWALVQLFLITKGTTVPGLLFKQYGLSGANPNVLGAIFQFLIILVSFIVVMMKNYIREWRFGFLTIFLLMIAFSLNSYTLIRSRANPYIDENDPETIQSLRNYMDRKQYGQQSLWTLMFHRKGSWQSQFGTHNRMGFWGFFRNQWGNPDKIPHKFTLNGWLFFILGYLGIAYAAYKNPRWGSLLFFTTLISTIGLLLYLNFADGTRGIHLEVRDRDYFYTPGFMFFGALMGLGVSAILSFIYRGFDDLLGFLKKIGPLMFFLLAFGSLIIMALVKQDIPIFLGVAVGTFIAGLLSTFIKYKSKSDEKIRYSGMKNFVIVILGLIFLAVPALSPATYWFENNRSRNHIPYDYAFNILDSVDKNGIIFTNGDNDTFPLWFLQAVPKVRADVKIVNLSLLNTPWYIKQIKRAGVPVNLTDDQIEMLHAYRDQSSGKIIRVQDLMVDHIINNSPVKRKIDPETGDTTLYLDPPVFFAVTVAPDNKVGYDPYLRMEGLAYRVTTTENGPKIDIPKMRYNLFKRYQYRGLKDTTIYKDENSVKLLQNYTTGFITLAYEYRKQNDTTNVLATINKMNDVLPFDWRASSFSGEFYGWANKWNTVDSLYNDAQKNISSKKEIKTDEARLFQMYFEVYFRAGKIEEARKALKDGLAIYPDDNQLFKAYIGFLYKIRDKEALVHNLEIWTTKHPDDKEFVNFYNQVKSGALDQLWKKEADSLSKAEKSSSVVGDTSVKK